VTKAERETFERLVAQRHVSERYGASVVVITCEHCHVSYERDRNAGRRETVADRRAAIEHAATVHGWTPLVVAGATLLATQMPGEAPKGGK